MTEYQQHLDEYKSEYYLTYTTTFSEDEWGNENLAKQYLDKYWLNETEYKEFWIKIKNTIFTSQFQNLPQNLFLPEFELVPMVGGILFDKEDFEAFRLCLEKTGDKYFVVIQNNFGQDNLTPFRMKFPAKISWNELMSGNYISTFLFEMFHNDFFTFGESAIWGKYTANDEEIPLDLFGIKKEFVPTFIKSFECITNKYESLPNSFKTDEIIKSLPESYKKIHKIHSVLDRVT